MKTQEQHKKFDVNTVCDYVIFSLTKENSDNLNNLKLQKLLYYIQAWHLAFYKRPLFEGKFQAWIHGPVNREIYDRFEKTKYLFSEFNEKDIADKNFFNLLDEDARNHINNILEAYSKFSGIQLEIMTHKEDPWIKTRKTLSPIETCEEEIDEKLIGDYYRARLDIK